jgi:T-complex protein 1 subunit alpha
MSPSLLPAMPKRVTKAKIACLDFSLQKAKMKMGVQVLVTDPEKLEDIRKRLVTTSG